jgi:hypothetical protein
MSGLQEEEAGHEHKQVPHKVVASHNEVEGQVEDSSYHVLVQEACSAGDHYHSRDRYHSQDHWHSLDHLQSKEEDSSVKVDPMAADLASAALSVHSAAAAVSA